MKVASDALRFLIPLLLAALLAGWAGWYGTSGVLALLALFVLAFFRDPDREVPSNPGLIVSPADGKIVRIETGSGSLPLQVSIFLSIFDVHINRSPVAGRVAAIEHHEGKFKAAFDDSASVENERTIIDLESGSERVRVTLIAGLIARRIVSWVRPGESLQRGQKIGLIRFGSRVDLFLPASVQLQVKKADRVRGGASIIGRLRN
jgi:phosphatidylserine decarboxylase